MIPFRMNPMGITLTEEIPLTLTAEQANSTVTLNATGSPTVSGLHYRLGKTGTWLTYTPGSTITLANIGDSVQFWNSAESLSSSSSSYVYFAMNGAIKAQGNIQSLLNFSESCQSYCFFSLFTGCASLISAPIFPAKTLADSCYRATFNGCSGMVTAPELPALNLAANCYRAMFLNCRGLVNAPALPALNLAAYCYNSLFNGCSSLVIAPDLPAMTLEDNCYSFMFRYCTNLIRMSVSFESWGSQGTSLWTEDVHPDGTFIKPAALPDVRGTSNIPASWTVVNK